MAATLDVISKGRLELGIGAGWNRDEYQAYGVPFPETRVRVEQMREGIEIIKRMWAEEKVNYLGRYFGVKDASCEPKPLQEPYPLITVVGGGEKLTLRVAAEHANRSNWFGTPEQCKHKLKVLEARAKSYHNFIKHHSCYFAEDFKRSSKYDEKS